MRNFSPEELGELRMLYRNAASPKKQVGILAELYVCTRQDIERALGLPVTAKRPARCGRPRKTLCWTPKMEARLLALYAETHETAVIADKMGLPPLKVKNKLVKLRAKGKIIARRTPALSGCAKGGGRA